MKSLGILFDIDGVLTLPNTEERNISIIDNKLINFLETLHHQGIYFCFVTGRAYPWVQKFVLSQNNPFLSEIPIFMEYGLTSLFNKKLKVSKKARNFRDEFFFPILSSIKYTCDNENILFEITPFVDYPDHGSLWLEKKDGMISIGFNKLVSVAKVQEIVDDSVTTFTDDIRVVKHHLGCDILPKGWSKEQAAIKALNLLDPDKKIQQWYVFGDNESDKEMCKPFENVTFVDTKIGASETTLKYLQEQIFS